MRIDLLAIMISKDMTEGEITDDDVHPFSIRFNYPKELKACGEMRSHGRGERKDTDSGTE